MKQLNVRFNLEIFVVADSSRSSLFSTKPALGPTWAHVPSTKVFIQKQTESSETKNIAIITKSSRQELFYHKSREEPSK